MKSKNKYFIFGLFIAFSLVLALNLASAVDVKYCCEKTNYNAWCQNAPKEQCLATQQYKSTPTSCEATSFCKLGCCYNSNEGTCMENTPQRVCQESGGTWGEGKDCDIPQCNTGCCVLGSQAAFATLTRCKKLSSFYGLQIDFRANIGNELDCLSLASLSDEGACVYEMDYGKACKYTSRQACNSIKQGAKIENGTITGSIIFYKDYLCSAEDLGSICGPTQQTTCLDGKDEVYFVDNCGNPANIYDASKVNDKAYWRKKISKDEACSLGTNIRGCGNCDYFSGSVCKDSRKVGVNPSYGSYACSNLNCRTTSLGKPMKHGETWCETDRYPNSVGSRYYRHICMNGEEIVEPCADFRNEICLEDKITSPGVDFSQAACRVNRWQECLSQTEKIDCENTDRRDCKWTSNLDKIASNSSFACVPKYSPGLKFWTESSQGACAQANTQCVVSFEKGLIGKQKCIKNCECLEESWKQAQLKKCESVGDCGGKINFLNIIGNKKGYEFKEEKFDSEKEGGGLGGLFG